MAFNFYGTFTLGQWEAFKAFARIQREDLLLRAESLEAELAKTGIFIIEYDGPTPVLYDAPQGSYARKLLDAYRGMGGVPEKEMLLRSSDDPVYKIRAQPMEATDDGVIGGFSDVYSNGRRERGNQRFDRDLGVLVDRFKSWQLEAVKRKREHLEFKIKRTLDLSHQLQDELVFIRALLQDPDQPGSFDSRLARVEVEMARPGAANVVPDIDDVFGLNVGRPVDFTFSDASDLSGSEAQRGT